MKPPEEIVGVEVESPRAELLSTKGVVPGACLEEVCLCNNNRKGNAGIGKMRYKTTVSCPYTPSEKAKMGKADQAACWEGGGPISTPTDSWGHASVGRRAGWQNAHEAARPPILCPT